MKNMKKIGILGSRELACKISEWIIGQNKCKVIGIVAPPFKGWWDDKLEETAKKFDVALYSSIEDLLKEEPDILFSINYWKTIEAEHIKAVNGQIINIHHSYLLKYRGRYTTSWAIMNSRKLNCNFHGTTLHYITEKLDEGPIIASYKCPIEQDDTAETLFNRVEELAIEMFKENFENIINNNITSFLEPDKDYIFYDINSNKDLEINYDIPIEDVYDFVRAWSFKDRPKPYFKLNDIKIYLSL